MMIRPLAALALSMFCGIGTAQGAVITYTLSGTFDVSVGNVEYDDINATLTGHGKTTNVFLPIPNTPAVFLKSLTASVSGPGDVTLPDFFLFFANNGTDLDGFNDVTLSHDIITFSGLNPYDAVSAVSPTAVTFAHGGSLDTPYGKASILSGTDLIFSATVGGVPEPDVWAELLFGFMCLGLTARATVSARKSAQRVH